MHQDTEQANNLQEKQLGKGVVQSGTYCVESMRLSRHALAMSVSHVLRSGTTMRSSAAWSASSAVTSVISTALASSAHATVVCAHVSPISVSVCLYVRVYVHVWMCVCLCVSVSVSVCLCGLMQALNETCDAEDVADEGTR